MCWLGMGHPSNSLCLGAGTRACLLASGWRPVAVNLLLAASWLDSCVACCAVLRCVLYPKLFGLQRTASLGLLTFNDDLDCTAAVALAALLGATAIPGVLPLQSQVFCFFGAGQVRPQLQKPQLAGACARMLSVQGIAGLTATSLCLFEHIHNVTKGSYVLLYHCVSFAVGKPGCRQI